MIIRDTPSRSRGFTGRQGDPDAPPTTHTSTPPAGADAGRGDRTGPIRRLPVRRAASLWDVARLNGRTIGAWALLGVATLAAMLTWAVVASILNTQVPATGGWLAGALAGAQAGAIGVAVVAVIAGVAMVVSRKNLQQWLAAGVILLAVAGSAVAGAIAASS